MHWSRLRMLSMAFLVSLYTHSPTLLSITGTAWLIDRLAIRPSIVVSLLSDWNPQSGIMIVPYDYQFPAQLKTSCTRISEPWLRVSACNSVDETTYCTLCNCNKQCKYSRV
jgi:hypothetical protein